MACALCTAMTWKYSERRLSPLTREGRRYSRGGVDSRYQILTMRHCLPCRCCGNGLLERHFSSPCEKQWVVPISVINPSSLADTELCTCRVVVRRTKRVVLRTVQCRQTCVWCISKKCKHANLNQTTRCLCGIGLYPIVGCRLCPWPETTTPTSRLAPPR